jgi:hypothetical protein
MTRRRGAFAVVLATLLGLDQQGANSMSESLERIESSVVGGPDLGSGVHYRETYVSVDFQRGLAEYRQFSPSTDPDLDGQGIGYFRAPVPKERLQDLIKAIGSAPLEEPVSPASDGHGASLVTIRVRRNKRDVAVSFLSDNRQAVQKFDDLLSTLNGIEAVASDHPLQAIKLQMKGPPGPDKRFHFFVKNVGTMPLFIMHPIRTDRQDCGVNVALAPVEKPGYQAPEPKWKRLPVRTQEAGAPRLHKLNAGSTVELVSETWSAPKGGEYYAQAMLGMFDGPPAHDGLPVMRGRLFTEYLIFQVP